MKSTTAFFAILCVFYHSDISACDSHKDEITPYKFQTYEELETSTYAIPKASRFTTTREGNSSPDIIYYLSKPAIDGTYPITIFCGGSSQKENAGTIIHVHRYFVKEFLDIGSAMITLEQWGVDGHDIDRDVFMANYTRTQRLKDHQQVINAIKAHPLIGWIGKFILVGVSEGGPIVTSLTEQNQDSVLATMSWCGSGAEDWRDEMWSFLEAMDEELPEGTRTREEFNQSVENVLLDPTAYDKEFCGMSYLYHADTLSYPLPQYSEIKTPFLVVAGAKDSGARFADEFVQKAKEASMDITYIKVDDMDHFIRKRSDVIEEALVWLRGHMQNGPERKVKLI